MKILLALAVCFAYAQALAVSANFGESVAVTGGVQTSINFGPIGIPIASLSVIASADCNITLHEFINITAQFTPGVRSVEFTGSAAVGFSYSINPASVTVQANLTSPPLVLAIWNLINANLSVTCLQFNGQFYSQLDILSKDTISQKVVVSLPSAGVYLFVLFDVNAYVPTFYNKTRHAPAGIWNKFVYPTGLSLDVLAHVDNNVVVNFYNNSPVPIPPSNFVNYGAYFRINADVDVNLNATIKFAYNKTLALQKGINEASLRFAFYDTASASWKVLDNGGSLNITGGVVSQITTHFSDWAVVGQNSQLSGAYYLTPAVALLAVLLSLLL